MWVDEASSVDISHITRFFTNQQYDKESGLYYYNARYYDPHLGSFITPDPAMDGINHYAYCGGNPVNYTDPTGLMKTQEERQQARESRQESRAQEREYRKNNGIGIITSGNNAKNKEYWSNRWANGLGSGQNPSSGTISFTVSYPAAPYGGGTSGGWGTWNGVGGSGTWSPNSGGDDSSNDSNPYTKISINYPNSGGSFGWRTNPITGKREFHTGNDYSAKGGITFAGLSGTVRRARMGSNGEGNFVQIKGTILGQTFYANSMHNMKNTVNEDQKVNRDTAVGKPGSSGASTGPHIHHEVFTYSKNTELVNSLKNAGVSFYDSGSRIFFEPNGFYNYLDSNNISY